MIWIGLIMAAAFAVTIPARLFGCLVGRLVARLIRNRGPPRPPPADD